MGDETTAEDVLAAVATACEAFHYMPHVNGAVSDSTVDEVREEASTAIDEALAVLHPLIDRPLTAEQHLLRQPVPVGEATIEPEQIAERLHEALRESDPGLGGWESVSPRRQRELVDAVRAVVGPLSAAPAGDPWDDLKIEDLEAWVEQASASIHRLVREKHEAAAAPAGDEDDEWIDGAHPDVLRSKLRAVIYERDHFQTQRDEARRSLDLAMTLNAPAGTPSGRFLCTTHDVMDDYGPPNPPTNGLSLCSVGMEPEATECVWSELLVPATRAAEAVDWQPGWHNPLTSSVTTLDVAGRSWVHGRVAFVPDRGE